MYALGIEPKNFRGRFERGKKLYAKNMKIEN